ncbi:amidohydrolase family protein [Cupriavidus necator]|uniref:amidohydrolase family protein n=1 Tax=Cupriavidus necator TaxID=106590 RepID=UPI0014901E82
MQVHMLPELFLNEVDLLLTLDIDVVVDHFARVYSDTVLAPLVSRAVHRLLASGRAWLKLSGAYMAVPNGNHDLGRLGDFVSSVKEKFSSQLVWGTDWPHATEPEKPNDATLTNLLATWFHEKTVRDQILVSNPNRLYDFSE